MNAAKIEFNKIKELIVDRNFKLEYDEEVILTNFKGYSADYKNQLTWIKELDFSQIKDLNRGYFIVSEILKNDKRAQYLNLIFCPNPRLLFAKISQEIKKLQKNGPIDLENYIKKKNNVFISKSAIIASGVIIGANVVIGHNTTISEGTIIKNNIKIGDNNCIGGRGFGYVLDDVTNEYTYIEHFGGVLIESNVEIGNGVCIDKAVFGNTIISSGVKIDNLSQIAHNSSVGKNTLIMSNVVISGSCVIGSFCWISPSTTISNKVSIGNNTKVGIGSVVTKDLKSNSFYIGYPIKKIN